ncbi:MAG: hypothetical protein DYH06_04775 [Acidobacteria bacterium ACB2]|nr:hypothetical protein [Acidobacteria bacterium ACB2]
MRRAAPLLLAGLAALLAIPSCRGGRGSARFPGAPLVLVSVDTLRSDHLPFYGYGKVETPALSALRAESVLFERAYAQVPLTLPSHASLFTGLLPASHGIHDNLGYQLRAGVPTLAEALKREGYSTAGAVSSVVLNGGSGVGRGFDLWEDAVEPRALSQALSRVQRSGAATEALLGDWLESQTGERLFLFLHLYEPHTPYEPPEPFRGRFAPYDGEIAAADAVVGTFVERLKGKGLWDRALVVFLSDHGEGLGEHGEDEHGVFLYRWALQVPLLVKLPGGRLAGTSVAAPVALTDLHGTLLGALANEPPPAPEGSVSLLDLASGAPAPGRRLFAESFYARLHFGWSDLASLLDGRWHYVEAPRPELYDLVADPAELKDLAGGLPAPFRSLRIEMGKRRSDYEGPQDVDPETKAKLASLGYLTSGAAPGAGPLPDPKDQIGVVRDLKRASGLFHGGNYDEALVAFDALLAQNPRMLDVWDLKSQALQKLGRNEEALSALKTGIGHSPEGATHYLAAVASLCVQMGRLDEALTNAELARDRGDPAADDVLARVHLARKDYAAAEAAALSVVEKRPSRRLPYLVLARVAIARGDLAGALTRLDRVAELTARGEGLPLSGYHYLRGDTLGRMGRLDEARKELREEVRLFPPNLDAWTSLAALEASLGSLGEVRRTVEEMVEANPGVPAHLAAVKALTVVGDAEGAAYWRRAGQARFPGDRRFRAGG